MRLETALSSLANVITYSRVEDEGERVVVALEVRYLGGEPNNGYDDNTKRKEQAVGAALVGYSLHDAGVDDVVAVDGDAVEYWVFTKAQAQDDGGGDDLDEGEYSCQDDTADEPTVIQADSAREAAEEYVAGGDYEPQDRTYWVAVTVTSADGDVKTIKVAVEPTEPACAHGYTHSWREGAARGSGGGVASTDECRWCGAQRVTDTWATDRSDGTQGHTATWYEDPSAWFEPRPLTRWPQLRSDIEEGDVVTLADGTTLTVRGDDDELCGWRLDDAEGRSVGHMAAWLASVDLATVSVVGA